MKYALITGGSGGIGSAICKKVASMGYTVLIHYYKNKKVAEELCNEINKSGGNAETINFDIAIGEKVHQALNNWKKNHKGNHIEVLINSAGITKDGLLFWLEEEDWKSVININLNGFYYVTAPLIKDMALNKYGRIINIVSLSGLKGLPGQTNYAAAKAGVIGATKSLAQELGRKNITVNAVAPGYIRTSMTKNLDEKHLKRMVPVNRFGTPEEVAAVVGFLASEDASYVNGEVINVNGGLYS